MPDALSIPMKVTYVGPSCRLIALGEIIEARPGSRDSISENTKDLTTGSAAV